MPRTRDQPSWTNWSGTVRGNPRRVVYPATEEQISELLVDDRVRASGVSVVGVGHSYVPLASPSGRTLIDLSRHSGVVSVDSSALTVTVRAGTLIRELNRILASHGLALPNQSAIDVQTVAGAMATATHGSSPRLGSLSSHLVGIRLVDASGQVRNFDPGHGEFDAARAHLGCLGVVTEITLSVVPAFTLRKSVELQPLQDALADLPSLLTAEFAGMWWYPHTSRVMVWRAERTNGKAGPRASRVAVPARLVAAASRRSRLISRPVNAAAAWAACRQPTYHPVRPDSALLAGLPPRQQSIEYGVPLDQAVDAVAALYRTLRSRDIRITAPIDVRFNAADSAWLSPSHGRDTCYIGLSAYLPRATDSTWQTSFPIIDEVLAAHSGRPHWAKVHYRRPEDLAQSYPRWSEFHQVRRELDPERVFLSPYLGALFGENDQRP